MTTWNVPLQLNNLQAQISNQQAIGLTNPLNANVVTNGFSFSGNSGGAPSFVLGGTEEFKVITTDLTPHILVDNTNGVQLGLPSGYGSYKVTAPTVTPSATSDTQVATTAFVQSAISAVPPATATLSQVLTAGNTATNSITLNNSGVGTNVINILPNAGATDPQITLTDGTTTNTINKNGYTTRNSVQNSTHFLNFSDNSATGTGAIQKTAGISCNPSTNVVSATTFVGALTGNADTATTATNIAGGAGGSVPYQTGAGATALLANGTVGQVLTSAGTTLAPTWTTPSGGGGDLSTVLIAGNSAGLTDIDLNSQDLLSVNNITVASPYNFSVVSIFADATARDLALPSPYAGQMAFLTGSNKLQYWNTNWGNVSVILNNPVITGFTITTQYELIYVNASNTVITAPTLGGFTVVRFFPTTTTSGTITLPNTASVEYLLVAGGGGGAGGTMFASDGGGGGGGGLLTATDTMVELTSYALTVGGGGIAGVASTNGGSGANSSLVVVSGTITANGGGGGGVGVGVAGGSGGGGGYTGVVNAGGAGSQGSAGGSSTTASPYPYSGGGGGAGGVGSSSVGQGGVGLSSTITGATVFYAGGGGGGASAGAPAPATNPTGGNGGGGNGGYFNNIAPTAGTNGRGGGGGGRGNTTGSAGASGGSGVIVVKFPSYS